MDDNDLSPQAELERGQRMVNDGIAMQVRAQMRLGLTEADWIDQHASPLGRRQHLELARSGEVESRKIRGRVLIRKRELDAYIENKGLKRGKRFEEENVDDVLERITGGAGR